MFRTELPLTPISQQLPPSARVLTMGSCFADTLGSRLADYKVTTLVNPFGTVFNPLTACQLLRAAAGEDMDWQQHLVQARGRWQSYDLHTSLGDESPVALLQQIQGVVREAGAFLAQTDVVLLTLGTAFVYRLRETGELVSNCHKVPAEQFEKELLTPDEIINAVAETHAYLRRLNPRIRFVLTVSPVRHLKDTLPLNSVSKSVLRVACHYLSELLPDVSYFPAYELLLDDLRDYRFYAADMLHPAPVAEDYIWEKFTRTYFDQSFGRFRKEWESVRQALGHRPLYAAAPEHRVFLEQTLERLERLAPQANVQPELVLLRQRLAELPLPPAPPLLPVDEDEDDEERIDIGGSEVDVPAVELPDEAEAAWSQLEQLPTEDYDTAEAEPLPVVEPADPALAAEVDGEVLPVKKKRRSRGGAKRNKKKHAARLAAEAAGALATELSAEELPAVALPPAPAVVITAQSDLPLQTTLERRKRNSRRSKNRKGDGPDGTSAGDDARPGDSAAPAATLPLPTPAVSPEPTLVAAVAAEPRAAERVPSEPSTLEPGTPSAAEAAAEESRREGRTGRSASERRAAAVRKPHRPATRFKPLYAADAPEAAATTAVTITPAESAVAPEPVSAPSESVAAVKPAPVSAPAMPPVAAPAATVAPPAAAIPDTRGTGASGSLSSKGVATRQDRPKNPVMPAQPRQPAVPAAASATPAVPAPVVPTPPSAAAPADAPAAAPKPAKRKSRAKAPAKTAATPGAKAPAQPAPASATPAQPAATQLAPDSVTPAIAPVSATTAAAPRAAARPAARKPAKPKATPQPTPAPIAAEPAAEVPEAPAAKRTVRKPAARKPAAAPAPTTPSSPTPAPAPATEPAPAVKPARKPAARSRRKPDAGSDA